MSYKPRQTRKPNRNLLSVAVDVSECAARFQGVQQSAVQCSQVQSGGPEEFHQYSVGHYQYAAGVTQVSNHQPTQPHNITTNLEGFPSFSVNTYEHINDFEQQQQRPFDSQEQEALNTFILGAFAPEELTLVQGESTSFIQVHAVTGTTTFH
jgi:hypothetical protein